MAGNAVVGALRVTLGLDSAAFEKGLTEAQKKFQDLGKRLDSIGRGFGSVGKALTVGITAPVMAAAAGFATATNQIAQSISEMRAEAETAGVSFEGFQKLAYAAEKNQVSVEALTDGLKEMQLRADEFIATGKGSAADAFNRLGIGAKDLAAGLKEPEQLFQGLIGKLSKLDTAAQIRVADEIFGGTGGEQFVRLLKGGAEGLQQLQDEFVAMGGVVSSGQADDMRAYQEAMASIGRATQQVVVSIAGSGLIQFVTNLATKFAAWIQGLSQLNPELVKWGAIAAGVGAALGPVLIAVGAMISSLSAIIPVVAAVGGALLGLPLLPIIAGVTAVVAAFVLFKDDILAAVKTLWAGLSETLGPKMGPLFDSLKAMVGAVGEVFSAIFGSGGSSTLDLTEWGRVIGRILGAAVDLLTGAVGVITNILRALGALLRGDFSAMWSALGNAAKAALRGILAAFETLFPGVTEWVRKTVEGVRDWLVNRFQNLVVDPVKRKVEAVKGFFYDLYDAVVGNSYVPDMVTEVGQWMAKLDDNMVKPAQRATETAAQAFEAMQERVSRAMSGLMTDREKMDLDYRRDAKELEALRDAGPNKGGIDAKQYGELRGRLDTRYRADSAGMDAENLQKPDIAPLEGLNERGVKVLNDAWESINSAIDESREKFADAFEYGMNAAMRGDWQGVLQAIFGDVVQSAIRKIGMALFDMGGGSNPAGGGFSWSKLLGAAVGIPGFARGGSFTVGGSGTADSKLAMMKLSPRERVDISTVRQQRQGGPQGNMQVQVIPSPYFDVQVEKVARPIAQQSSAQMGRQVSDAMRRNMPGAQHAQRRLGTA